MASSRYTDFDGGQWPDMPGDLIPNGGVYRAIDGLFDRPGTFRKRGGTLSTTDDTVGFRYLAANIPGTAGLPRRVMGVNVYLDAANHYQVYIGEPTITHSLVPNTAHANETYMNFMVSSADNGNEVGGATGGGGATWTHSVGSASRSRVRVDSNENGHAATDMPVSFYHYQFFTPWPTNQYGIFFAIGDVGSVGVKTTTDHTPWPALDGSSATASNAGYFGAPAPNAGDLVLCFIMVRGNQTANPPTDTSGNPYTLVYSGTSPGGVSNYVYKRVAGAGEPVLAQTAVLSGSAEWTINSVIFSTPSSTNIYVMDEGLYPHTHPSDYEAIQVADQHGVQGKYGGYILNYPAAATEEVFVGKPFNYQGILVYPMRSKNRAANYPVIYGGVDLRILPGAINTVYNPAGDTTITAGSQLISHSGSAFTTNAAVGDMVVIRDINAAPTYAYLGQITKIVDDTHIYVEPTPTRSIVCAGGGLKTAPAVVMEDHFGLSPLSSDIACAWQYRVVFAAPSPWNATSGVRGPTDYSRSICWTTLPGETVSNHDDIATLYLDGYQQGFRESVMKNNFLTIPEMSGPITALQGLFATQLVAFTEHEIWSIGGDFVTNDAATTATDTIQVFNQSKSVGCINKDSLVATPRGLVFASGDGVYLYDGKSAHPLMHERMANEFRDSIEAGATVIGSGLIRHNHYILSLSDKTYLCNLDSNAWGELTNVKIFDAIDDPNDPSRTFAALYGNINLDQTVWSVFHGGQVIRIDTMFNPSSTNTADADGDVVTSTLITRSHNEGDGEVMKFYQQAMYEYFLQGAGTVTVSADTAIDPSRAIFNTIGTLPQNVALDISNATNASPIVVTTPAHGYATGDHVMIRNVGGNTEANGKWVITVLSATTFSLNGSTGNAGYTSGGTAKQDDAKAFNVKPKLKTGYGLTHKFVQSDAASQWEVRGLKHVYHPMRAGRAS